MEEIEYLLLNNINISLLKEELLRYNMELKYTSITKNININNNYQLRLYCSNNEYYYIYLDGTDQPIPENVGEANVIHCERIEGQVVNAEKRRLGHLSNMAEELLKTYDIVIGTDADEILIVDPNCNETLHSYLSKAKIS